ncbi:hypothetical protein N9R79_07845 [Vibrio sp.]|nr:hypothetical protein [Vibrio sp.]
MIAFIVFIQSYPTSGKVYEDNHVYTQTIRAKGSGLSIVYLADAKTNMCLMQVNSLLSRSSHVMECDELKQRSEWKEALHRTNDINGNIKGSL